MLMVANALAPNHCHGDFGRTADLVMLHIQAVAASATAASAQVRIVRIAAIGPHHGIDKLD